MSDSERELVKPGPHPRLPGRQAIDRTLGGVSKLAARTAKSVAEARKYNTMIAPDQQDVLYLASVNLIAEKIYRLARDKHSSVEELRIYLELFLKHREQKIKEKKTALMLRHIELLEQKRRALEAAVKNSGSDTELGEYVRKILGLEKPVSNGHRNQSQAPRLLGNGFAA
jgi:hypothetical protein